MKNERLPSLSAVEQTILGLLLENDELYGLEMVNASKGRLKRGTIYVTLARMEEKGFVTSRPEDEANHPGLRRPLYKVTGQGRRVYEAWQLAQNAWRLGGATS